MRSLVKSSVLVRASMMYLVASIVLFAYAVADAGTLASDAVTTATSFQVFWGSFVHYFNVVAPWLVVAGLPSIITALTPYPKAGGAVKALSVVLNVLSMLTHHDSPGTMKLPFTMSKPPVAGAYASPILSRAAVFLPILFVLANGCAGISPSTRAFGNAYAQCMEKKGLSVALDPGFEKEGLAILSGGVSKQGVVDDLEGLAGRATVDGVTCLVTSWLGQRGAALNPNGVAGGNEFLRRHAAPKPSKIDIIVPARG